MSQNNSAASTEKVDMASRLFETVTIGNMHLRHRVAMSPMTRSRVLDGFVPDPSVKDYYRQRASVPGTLIITEGITVSPSMTGGFLSPGIWSREQIHAWKGITEEVHRQGSFIVAQLFGFGRAATVEGAQSVGIDIVGPSAIPIGDGYPTPRPMTIEEIRQTVSDFATASKNAIEAGFDGVECHVANGYIADQFLREVSNQRSDIYGGSLENRARFADEVLEAMVAAVGADRVGMRLSPFSPFQGMHLDDPRPQHEPIIQKANRLGIMYLSLVESRIAGAQDHDSEESLDFAYKLWKGPLLIAGGYKGASAKTLVDQQYPDRDVIVLFGRMFVSNPDLVYRLKEQLPLTQYDRSTFYSPSAKGYTDYAFSNQYLKSLVAA